VPFLREPGVALTPRQIAHRQTMLDYWNQRRRGCSACSAKQRSER
jgi:hypothetical protein